MHTPATASGRFASLLHLLQDGYITRQVENIKNVAGWTGIDDDGDDCNSSSLHSLLPTLLTCKIMSQDTKQTEIGCHFFFEMCCSQVHLSNEMEVVRV